MEEYRVRLYRYKQYQVPVPVPPDPVDKRKTLSFIHTFYFTSLLPRHPMTTSTGTSSSSRINFWKKILLPIVATLNVPPYSMLIWFSLYVIMLLTTNSLYLRSLLIAYWIYCILETRSPRTLKQSWLTQRWQNRLGRLWFVQWTAEYFQTHLVKTAPLPPSSTYIFCYHPHGVIGMGASLALTTNGCDFDKVFPGVSRLGR